MKYEECLRQAPPGYLESLAARNSAPLGLGRDALVGWLCERALSRARLAQLVDSFDDAVVATLKGIVYSAGGAGVTVEQCNARIRQLTGKGERGASQLLGQLIDSGLIFVGRVNYRQVYFVPEDARRVLIDVLSARVLERVVVSDALVTTRRDDGSAISGDIVRFLSFLRMHDVRLTQAGVIYRHQQREIMETFLVREEIGDDPGELTEYPDRLGFIVGFARWRRLVERTQGQLRLAPRVQDWLRTPSWQVWSELYQYWRDLGAVRDNDFDTVLSLALSLPTDNWIALPRLIQEIEPMTADRYHGNMQLRLQKQFVEPLLFCGWLTMGTTDDGLTAFHTTAAGRAVFAGEVPPVEESATSFILQPSFDVLVPRNIDPAVLWELEGLAELIKPDQVLVYRLSKDSVYRALCDGRSGEDIVSFLTGFARNGLPQNIAADLREWSEAYGRVRFQEVCLLMCDTPALADTIRLSRRCGSYILGALSPTALLIDRNQYGALMDALIADGHLPRPGVSTMIVTGREPAPIDEPLTESPISCQ
jgi:hypothetical protein